MMYRCKICSEHYLSTESLQDHQFASHTEEALEAFGITKVSANETKVLDWQQRSNENKHDILQKMGYPPHDIQTLMSLEFYQFGSNIQKEIGEALNKSTPVKQRTQAVETDENKTYKNMYDSYLQARSAQIKRPFQDGATESKASEVSDLDKEGIFKLLSEMYEDYNRDNGSGISVSGYGFIYVEREFPHLTKKEINKTIDDWHNTYSFGESKANEDSIDDDDREGRMQWITDAGNQDPITDEEAELLLYGTTDGSKGGTWTGNVSRPRGESKASEVDENEKDDIFQYLFELQDSGETNMMGASPYVEREFPHLDKKEISDIVVEWMSNWDEIAKRMGIESKASEGFDQGGIIGYVDAKCKTCGVEFNSPQMMDAHYRDNRDHESNLRDLNDASDISVWTESLGGEALKSHTDYHKLINSTLSGETTIPCSKCTKKFKGQESLNIHYNDKHADNELKSLVGELNSGEGHWVNSNPFDLTSELEYVEDEDYEVTPAPKPEPEQKEEGEAMVEDIVHKTESGVDITHPQDEWCELCDKPTTSFEADDMSDDDYDEKVEDLMKDEGVDEITDFDEEEKKDFFEDVDDIKTTDEEQTEDGEAVGLSNNWDDDEKRMDGGDVPQVEEDPYKDHYTGDARKQMQNDIKDLSNPYDLTTDIKGKPWQQKGESLTEEQELQQARESLAPLNKLDDEKSNVTKAFESGASAEDIYSKVGDTTQDRGSEDDLTDIYNNVGVKLNLEKV